MSCDIHEQASACVMLFECSIYTGLKYFDEASLGQISIWGKLDCSQTSVLLAEENLSHFSQSHWLYFSTSLILTVEMV